MTTSALDQQWAKIRAQVGSQVPAIQRPAHLLVAVEDTLGPSQRAPEAYWVALLSTLDQLASDPKAAAPTSDKRQLLEATLYLLGLLAPHLDPQALRAKHAVLKTLQPLLASFAAHAPALKSLVALAQALLVAAPAQALEKDLDGCRSVYATVLSLCADARPKVRRRAQEAVHAVLASPPPPAAVHPYADETAQWVCAKLDEALRAAKRGGKAAAGPTTKTDEHGADESRAIALLTFIRNLGASWPISATPTLLPLLLSTLTLSSQHLTLAALTLLSHLFSAAHAAEHLSDDHVRDTLEALVQARPKVAEGTEQGEKLLGGWVEGVGEGMVAYARTDSAAALERLTTLFPSTLSLLAAASTPALRLAVETACALMIRHCLTDAEILAAGPVVRGVVEQVEKALTSARYAAQAQPHVLALAKALFLRLRLRDPATGEPAAATQLSKVLVLVGKQREDSRFEWKKEADAVLDSAIKVLGPETVLRFLPLGLSADNANPAKARAWLLPLLKPAITNTRLTHFRDVFVPLSAGFFNKAEEAKAGNRAMEAKVWETLVGQVWALLPGYCEYPTDLVEAFSTDFVSLVANVVYTQPALRPSVFKALSTLLSTTLVLANSTSPPDLLREQFGLTPADGQASLAHLRALAQTVLSVAFNVYGKMSRGEGGYVLETVAAWVAILPADELAATYERVSGLAAQALDAAALTPHHASSTKDDPTLPPSHALLDILVTLVPQARGTTARALFDFALSDKVVASGDAAVQKKGYRILARLCEESKSEVLKGREGEVIDKVVEGAGKVANGAKRDRVSLLAALVPLIPADSLHIVPSLIPEAVLGTKESNGVTREAAYNLLVSMGQKMASGGRIKRHLIKGMEDSMEDEVDANEEEFVTMLSAGLAAANPHMIAASIGALGRLVWEFHTTLDDSYLAELVDTIAVFLTSANREIVKAGLGFVKIAVVTLKPELVTPSLPQLVPSLVNWSHEHSNHFKVKIRHLLERMIRRFGYDAVERHVPEDDKKLVSNIRKRHARSKKKKAAQATAAGMDVDGADSDEEGAPRPQAAGRSAYDEVLYGSESDVSASEDEAERGAGAPEQGKTAPSGVKNRKAMARKAKKQREEGGAYIQEGEDEVLDLLDDRMMSRISAAKPAAPSASRKPLDSHFKTDGSGRYRFEESGSDNDSAPAAGPSRGAGMGDYVEAMHGEDGHTRDARGQVRFNKTQGKRARGGEDDYDDDDAERDVPVTAGLKELEVSGGGKRKKQKKEVQRVGQEFKAKRAGGDVKKDGMQPYAFVPLSQVAGKKSNQRGPKLGITGLKRAGGKK